MRFLLVVCIAFFSSLSTTSQAQTTNERPELRVGLWNSSTHPLADISQSVLLGKQWAASQLHQAEMRDPLLVGLSLTVETKNASVAIIKPVSVIGHGLPQSMGTFSPIMQNDGSYYQPGTFNGLVSFVGAIRLNLNNPSDAQEGFTWSMAFGPPQNGYADVGMALRYKRKF